jgi:hypothetical protein
VVIATKTISAIPKPRRKRFDDFITHLPPHYKENYITQSE